MLYKCASLYNTDSQLLFCIISSIKADTNLKKEFMGNNQFLFVIGAQRSGTTYLYKMLEAHPEIEMAKPMRPEPKYFLRDDIATLKPSDYEEMYFADSESVTWRGEKSTTYLERVYVAERIKSWFPDAKIVIMLRNPIHRAVSNYYFTKKHGLEPLPLDEALYNEEHRRDDYDKTKISASPYAYLQRGHYINYLQEWAEIFPREQMIINIFEEFVGNLKAVQAMYARLDIDAAYVPDEHKLVVNASQDGDNNIDISSELEQYLHAHFEEANHALEKWLGRSIPSWKPDL